MSDFIIRVENLGKKYKIRHQQDRQRYVALRDVIAEKAAAPLRWLRQHGAWSMGHGATDKHGAQSMEHGVASNGRPSPDSQLSVPSSEFQASGSEVEAPGSLLPASQSAPSPLPLTPSQGEEEFWALRGVNFEVKQGEVLGIIGRNGAGKTTLLKILSRITEPTEGRVRIRGRVASLLEVGTGFHPELTGRENIFVNGAILGMTRAEVQKKFDQIVDFSGVEKFLDTPVKRYSSGMYVRLAFAVAAHLDPEILVVDEVLAVGDAEFQKKCLGKMSEVARGGRTVLFVSHQMAAAQNLCHTGLLLYSGRVASQGNIAEVIHHYQHESTRVESAIEARLDREGSGAIRFTGLALRNEQDMPLGAFVCGAPGTLVVKFNNPRARDLRNFHFSIGVDNAIGQRVLLLDTAIAQGDFPLVSAEAREISVKIPALPLLPGRYYLTLYATVNGTVADWIRNAGTFDVESGDFFGTGRLPPMEQGVFVTRHSFLL